jgi:hypothetical protein
LNPPCSVAAFVVNSEPHTGARPSVRLYVGPELACFAHYLPRRLARHRLQRRVLRRQRYASRPHQCTLPRGLRRQIRALRGALRPLARRDRRFNLKSPLGELFSPGNLVNHTRGQNMGQRPLQKG